MNQVLLTERPPADRMEAVRAAARAAGGTAARERLERILRSEEALPAVVAESADLDAIKRLSDALHAAGASVATMEDDDAPGRFGALVALARYQLGRLPVAVRIGLGMAGVLGMFVVAGELAWTLHPEWFQRWQSEVVVGQPTPERGSVGPTGDATVALVVPAGGGAGEAPAEEELAGVRRRGGGAALPEAAGGDVEIRMETRGGGLPGLDGLAAKERRWPEAVAENVREDTAWGAAAAGFLLGAGLGAGLALAWRASPRGTLARKGAAIVGVGAVAAGLAGAGGKATVIQREVEAERQEAAARAAAQTAPPPSPERGPFAKLLARQGGGEPASACAKDLPKFAGLVCEFREMTARDAGAVRPDAVLAPEDAVATPEDGAGEATTPTVAGEAPTPTGAGETPTPAVATDPPAEQAPTPGATADGPEAGGGAGPAVSARPRGGGRSARPSPPTEAPPSTPGDTLVLAAPGGPPAPARSTPEPKPGLDGLAGALLGLFAGALGALAVRRSG
ncbi:MAG: hypothetical protein ACOZNI_09725 [Myxococcota bacterium]